MSSIYLTIIKPAIASPIKYTTNDEAIGNAAFMHGYAARKLYFSNDLAMDPSDVLLYKNKIATALLIMFTAVIL